MEYETQRGETKGRPGTRKWGEPFSSLRGHATTVGSERGTSCYLSTLVYAGLYSGPDYWFGGVTSSLALQGGQESEIMQTQASCTLLVQGCNEST